MKVDLPPNYSLATWGRGFTFTWRIGKVWRQATDEMGQPWPDVRAAATAAWQHSAGELPPHRREA